MKRRNAIKSLGIAAGAGLVIPSTLFSACHSDTYEPQFFSKETLALLHEVGETILPETEDSPGAKALKIAHFMDAYVAACYDSKGQKLLQEGLMAFQETLKQRFNKSFKELQPEQRHQFLVDLDETAQKSEEPHYFSLLKGLVVFGYFTSEEGATKALRYLPIPGKYEGDYPYKEGEKAWALG